MDYNKKIKGNFVNSVLFLVIVISLILVISKSFSSSSSRPTFEFLKDFELIYVNVSNTGVFTNNLNKQPLTTLTSTDLLH